MGNVSTEVKRTYKNRVLNLRLKAGFAKQKEFATRTGISPSILCDIESNRKFLSAIYALRISEVLGCKVDDLYERQGEPRALNERLTESESAA